MPMCLPLVSWIFVVFLRPHCSWRLLLEWRITSKDCIAETPAHCGPARTKFRHKSWPERHLQYEEQWQGVCKPRPGHGNTMNHISKTKDRHRTSFASYCFEKVNNKGQRAIWTKECERRKETKLRTRQKGNTRMYAWIKCTALNTREPVRKGLELRHGTTGCHSEDRETLV